MANISRTIDIIFGGVDNVSPATRSVIGSIGGIDSAVQGIAQPFANFTHSLLKAEAGIAALGGAMIAFSVNEAAKLKTSVNEIGTLFNATPAQVETLRTEILAFGKDSVFSFDNITGATYSMISATGDVKGAVSALSVAEQGAVVGATDLNTAVNALTTITNSYGFSLGSSNDVLGAFIIAVQNGKTTLPELGANIGNVAATAAGSKVPFDDLLASVAALTAGGINTAQSMTSLNALLTELAKPSDKLKTALGGVTLETDGLQGVMRQLEKATNGDFTAMTSLFGSIEATKGAMVLANDSAGVFDKTLAQMDGKSDVLSKNFDLMAKNTDLAMQKLVNNIKGTLVAVGNPLLDEFGTSINALSSVFKTLGVSVESGALKQIEDALNTFATNASATLDGVAKSLPEALGQIDFSGLIDSFTGLGDVFTSVFGSIFGDGIDLTKPKDLANALQTAVNIAESFVNITAGIIKEFKPIFDALGEAGKRVGETSKENDKAIGKFLGAMTLLADFGTAMGALAIIVNETGTDVGNIFDFLGGGAKIAVNVVQSAFDLIVGSVAKTLADIATAFEIITPAALGIPWGNIAKDLTELGDAAGKNFSRNMKEAGDGLTMMGQGLSLIDKPAKAVNKTLDDVKKTIEPLKKSIKEVGATTFTSADAFDKYNASLKKTGNESGRTDAEINKILKTVYGVEKATSSSSKALDKNSSSMNALAKSTSNADAGLKNVEKSSNKLSEAQILAIKNTHDLEKQLLKMASNERIKAFEYGSKIKVASIQADAKQVVAAYKSIGQSVTALTASNSSLWGSYSKVAGYVGGDEIQKAALRNETRLNDELQLQRELTNSTIDKQNAQIAALNSGGAMINISADNLAPELQAVLESLIDNIRIKSLSENNVLLT